VTPEKLEKIRRLANDVRGDPATRAIAHGVLKRYDREQSKPEFRDVPSYDNRVHPGMRESTDYIRRRFFDLGTWGRTKSGDNPAITVVQNGRTYLIVLFEHRRTPTWGWMRKDVLTDFTEFSANKFQTMAEAHDAAWTSLMSMRTSHSRSP
jgi:hypothetical protein